LTYSLEVLTHVGAHVCVHVTVAAEIGVLSFVVLAVGLASYKKAN
jgi:hypothetical protein